MDSTYGNDEISPQQVYIEDAKGNSYSSFKEISLSALDDIMERILMRKEKTESMKIQRLTFLLNGSIKGKTTTGDSVDELVKLLVSSPLFQYLHNLNNPTLFNIENSAIDFGEKPIMIYGKGLCKRFGNSLIPNSDKNRLVVEYSECSPQFSLHNSYEDSALEDHQVTKEEFNKTIKGAEEVLAPFKGVATRSEIYFMLFVFIGLILSLTIGITLGRLISYIITIVISLVFLAAVITIFIYLRKRNKKLLVYAHLVLALYVRCENNRYYLRKKILVRPGYMAKWIEFNSLSFGDNSTIGPL